jgi:hypothetical protein
MVNKRHHYVPQYYLKQFRGDDTNRVLVSMVEPYRCVGLGSIKGQCQHDHFYGKNGATDAMLQETEQTIAPTLYQVNASRTVSDEQWQGLRLLAVQLHLRTRKAAELAKIFPRFMADQVIQTAIKKGELPPPKGGWHADMMDFEGVPQTLLGPNLLFCYFETATLRGKLLSAPPGSFFITSDNPAITLNQFAADAKGVRDYVGFAQAGFQLVLPLGATLCAFLYDPFVYKVGDRNAGIVQVSADDVELLNSLQVQSAERCLYAHRLEAEPELKRLVARYARLRQPHTSGMKSFPQNDKETLIKFSDPPMVIPRRWQFCGYVKKIRRRVGDRRDPGMSHINELLVENIRKKPAGVVLEERLEQVIQSLPEHGPIPVVRRPGISGGRPDIRLPDSPRDWKVGPIDP